MSRAPTVLIADVRVPGHGADAQRVIHRAALLARRGGGTLLAPASAEGPLLLPGVRHRVLNVPPGLGPEKRAAAVADRVAGELDRLAPAIVHALGLRSAVPALLRRGVRVVVEPGLLPSQWLRAHEPELPAARLVDLVELEDKTLSRAHAVVTRSSIEGAVMVKRGVSTDRVWIAFDGVPEALEPAPPPDLPHVLFVGDLEPWSGWELPLAALARVKLPWRFTLALPSEASAGGVVRFARSLGIANRVNVVREDGDLGLRAVAAQIVVCPLLAARPVVAGAIVPSAALWALAYERPLVASDVPAVRAYAGAAACYFEPGDVGALAEALRDLMSNVSARERLCAEAARLRSGRSWAPADEVIAAVWDTVSP